MAAACRVPHLLVGAVRILVCGGKAFRDWRMVYRVCGELWEHFGNFELVLWGDSKACRDAAKWAKSSKAISVYENVFETAPDLVVAFPGVDSTVPLRQAWRKRIPGLKLFSDGSYVRVGYGWSKLLKKRKAKRCSS